MGATKTTFYLPDHLRHELKKLAAARNKTVTELLTEGAEHVVARGRAGLDRDILRQRAAEARRRLRRGIYEGAPISAAADETIYSAQTTRTRQPRRRQP